MTEENEEEEEEEEKEKEGKEVDGRIKGEGAYLRIYLLYLAMFCKRHKTGVRVSFKPPGGLGGVCLYEKFKGPFIFAVIRLD